MNMKQLFPIINADIQKAVDEVAKKHGVKITVGGTLYSTADYTVKLKVATKDAEKIRGEESKKYAQLLGLPENVIGLQFKMGRDNLEVVELDPGKPKNCIVVKKVGDTSDKRYLMSAEALKHHAKIK